MGVVDGCGPLFRETQLEKMDSTQVLPVGCVGVPGFTEVTPSPTLSTTPPPSCPSTQGKIPSGSFPLRV